VLGLLLSAVVVVLVVAVAAALAVGTTAVPFVMGVDMAERRGFSTTRWGGIALVCAGLAGGLLLLAVLAHSLASLFWIGAAALVGWATPGLLSLLSEHETEVGGYQGAHEH
jgi:hypothetical protein